MKQVVLSILILLCSIQFGFSQEEEILLTIGDTEISKAEFERIYKKNNQNLFDESEKKTPEEYIELFIDYKLKVIEAENLKMDTTRAFQEELAGYRADLAAPYLTDVQFDENMIREYYDRMKKEINASHILLQLASNASAEEESAVLSRITEIRQEILDGKDFGEAAVAYSEDPSAISNKGNLGYFTAFQMVAPFENAAYNLNAGEVSEPVRTSFGYHLIKVHDIRDNRGEVKVAHILKMFNPDSDNNEVRAEIDSIYEELENGADFAELADEYSDDRQTAVQGGEMQWFKAGQIIPEFSEPAFSIEETGQYTQPIETQFGYHIIKRLDHRPIPPFEEVKAEIENKIKQDPTRSLTSKKAFIEKLKEEYNFTENEESIALLDGKNIGDDISEESRILFTLSTENYTIADFLSYLEVQNTEEGSYLSHYENWIESEITAYENSRLEKKYPEFRYLLQEYHDGILLFNIMEEKIWNYAATDSSGLQEFYENTDKKFLTEERFEGSIITVANDSIRLEVENYLAADVSETEVTAVINSDEQLVEFNEGNWEEGENSVVDYYIWNAAKPADLNPDLTFLNGEVVPPRPKTLSEARGLYVSEYQNYLEEEWIKELREKYKIKIKKRLLKRIPNV